MHRPECERRENTWYVEEHIPYKVKAPELIWKEKMAAFQLLFTGLT
jgi:hypothetical protein